MRAHLNDIYILLILPTWDTSIILLRWPRFDLQHGHVHLYIIVQSFSFVYSWYQIPQGSACVGPTFCQFLAILCAASAWWIVECKHCQQRECCMHHQVLYWTSNCKGGAWKSTSGITPEEFGVRTRGIHVGPKLGFAAPSSDFWKFLCAAVKKRNLVYILAA